jgi:hypothetical protein
MKKKVVIILLLLGLSLLIFVIRNYFYPPQAQDVVTLMPDDSATKKKPKDPGGLALPNSDSLVYERLKGGKNKEKKINLLPDPEEPIEIVRKQKVKAKLLDSIDEILDNIKYYENEYTASEKNDTENLDYVFPNVLLLKDDSNLDENSIYVPGTSLNIIKALESEYKIANVNVVDEEEGGYKIQLASAYSQNDAKKKWQNIYQKHKKILSDANLIIKKIEGKNERIFFLVMAGSYPSLSHAKLLCKKLSKRKQNCIVTK